MFRALIGITGVTCLAAIITGCSGRATQSAAANSLDEPEYTWSQLLARDAILPIYQPEFVPAQDAPYTDDELVIGVELNGEARAYAIGPLNSREIVNDTVGGVPILVTW